MPVCSDSTRWPMCWWPTVLRRSHAGYSGFRSAQQALQVFPLLLLVQLVQFSVRTMAGADFPGLAYFVGPCLATLLWPVLTFVLLLPQHQPVDRDANRPL
jgi:rod shape-determining protein MreD